MKNLTMVIGVLALGGLLLLGGCGKSELVKSFEDLADKACKCKDAKCATDVTKEFLKISSENKDKKVTKGDAEKIEAASKKYAECVAKASAAGAPTADEKKADEPKADEKKDEPKADDEKADDEKADDEKADDEKADDETADDEKADEEKKDEPAVEDKKDEPAADEKKADEPAADAPAGDMPEACNKLKKCIDAQIEALPEATKAQMEGPMKQAWANIEKVPAAGREAGCTAALNGYKQMPNAPEACK